MLGRWIRDWRHANRWTQERLAEALGYEVSYVAKVERGVRPPSRQLVARLADVVDLPREELLQLSRRPSPKVRLPLPVGPIVGRSREAAEVARLVRGPTRCVTLVGAPGIGKTRLALEVAWDLAEEFRHGACFVPFADLTEARSVPPAMVYALGLLERRSPDLETLVVDALRCRQMLLILDNFEHVLDARGMVEALLERADGVRILVTSRQALGIEAEAEYRVPTLAFPDAGEALHGRAQDFPALEVFVTRARRARPDFALTEANAGAVAEICARLDGLPLGITLTAAATRLLSPADIARTLRERVELPGDDHGDPLAHGRLAAALDWSWDLLEPADRALLARLGVFSGTFGLAAVEAVCSGGGANPDPLAGLAALESKHLVEVSRVETDDSRFALLETIRRYALERLRDDDAVEEMRARHCAYYLHQARAAALHLTGGPEQAQWLRLVEADFPNLAAAFEWVLPRDPATALELCASLWRFFLLRRTTEGRRWLERALAEAPGGTLAGIQALNGSAVLARTQGHLELAERFLQRSRASAVAWPGGGLAVRQEFALAILNQGIIEQDRGRYDLADASFVESLAIYRELGDERGIGHGVNCLGVVALRRNDLDSAAELFYEALTKFRALRDPWSIAVTANNLGWIAEVQGELVEANDWYDETRQMWDTVGDEHGFARSLADLGRVARRRRDLANAGQLLKRALTAFHRLGDSRLAAACLVELAAVAAQRRRRDVAARLLGAAEGVRRRIDAPAWPDEVALEEEVSGALRRGMGDTGVDRALSIGRTLSLEDAIALVESGTRPQPPPRPLAASSAGPAATFSP